LHAGALTLWAQPDERHWTGSWLSKLNALSENPAPSREAIEDLGGMCAIACAMPDYQGIAHYGAPGARLSPNLVMLADCDGGLYGRLANDDRWFDTLLIDVFSGFDEDHGVHVDEMALAVFPRADVVRLHRLAVDYAARSDLHKTQRWALERLVALTARVLADHDAALCVRTAL
jgi:hypothetical protein